VQRLITEGESFAILRDIGPVSRGVGECFECTEIRGQLDAAVQKAIQILNDATDGVCDMEGDQFRTEIRRMIRQILDTSTDLSAKLQAFSDLAQNLESLADAYKLLIKGSCEDPQATKFRLARALDAASVVLYSVASLHTRARNDADAIDCLTESAALSQSCSEMYLVSGDSESQARAFQGAASALRSAAALHSRLGNHGDAIDCNTESAALSQVCAEIYHGLEKSIEEVDALKSAASALRSAAALHSRLGNHAGAIDCYTASAALYQRCAQIYGVSEAGESQADALESAADALHDAAISHFQLHNHAGAIDCYTASAALYQRCAQIYGVSEAGESQADALKSAADALHDAAISHFQLHNHAGAIDCYTASAALYQRCAEMYHVLADSESQAEALQGAALALRNAARSHSQLGNHEAAEEATRESARLLTERERILVSLANPRA
jgi:hypothetical protein